MYREGRKHFQEASEGDLERGAKGVLETAGLEKAERIFSEAIGKTEKKKKNKKPKKKGRKGNSMLRKHAKISAGMILYGALILVIVVISGFVIASLRPTWLGLEREAYVSSHQYIESKNTQLIRLVTQYDELETEKQRYLAQDEANENVIIGIENQQAGLVLRVREESQRIPPDRLPESVQRFLREHR